MATVVLRHLEKTFPGGYRAVRDVSLEVADGEFVVLVGPSGCGKSTTLRIVAGLEEASAGEVLIDGRVVNHVAPGDRDIAMVFQNYALYPHLSVRDNMAFGLRMRRVPRPDIDRRVAEAARILSLESLLERRPRELSGGQRQRVALGRAIVREPKVFLFDEPLSNLDAKLRVQMRAEIARLHRRLGATIVYVTHDQVEAMTLGDRLVLMDQGTVRQIDPPLRVYREPADRFVAGFIGSPAMNFFPGTLIGSEFELADGGRVSLTGRTLPATNPGPAVLGVRPEDLLLMEEGDAADHGFATVTAEVVERLGHETLVHFDLGGKPHVARLAGDANTRPGGRLTLAIRHDGWHLFAADPGGRRLA
jgi:multiple sugar transport system ATP-binding protein